MSRKGRRRAVFASELRTPEDGLALKDREDEEEDGPTSPAESVAMPQEDGGEPPPPEEPPAAAAAAQEPNPALAVAARLKAPADAPCRDCWLAGRDAAVKAAEAGGVEAARVLSPRGLHWRAAWLSGRDAAVAVLAGR